MGAELLSPSDLAEFSNAFCASKPQALIAEALVDFDDRKTEGEEWEASHELTQTGSSSYHYFFRNVAQRTV